jgi:hypothetical protein
MKIGTKSLLFGVHQFIWHPLTVTLAWRRVWGQWPTWQELAAIVVHDWGYWGCPNMDGDEGRGHPIRGARLLARLGFNWSTVRLAALHSRSFANSCGVPVSKLFLPDKVSVLYDPQWFYLLRGFLSGEVFEYRANSPKCGSPCWVWLDWYRNRVREKLALHEKTFPIIFRRCKT